MKSTRLPNKVLMPIPFMEGKPLIQWIVDELKNTRFLNETIVATSLDSENDILVDYCRSNKIKYFRGDEENVLSRFIEIAKLYKFDVIVRLTGDNPILDLQILENAIQLHLDQDNDYTKTEGLPIGMNFEIIKPAAILGLENKQLSSDDKEHVTFFIQNSAAYKKQNYLIESKRKGISNLRLTIDYASDYLVVSTVLKQTNRSLPPGVDLIYKTLDEYPWIFEANKDNFQKVQFKTEEEEIKAATQMLEDYDFKRAATKLREVGK